MMVFLCLAALPRGACPVGVLAAQASVEPEHIAPGATTQVTVKVSDGMRQPIASASVKISAGTGYFESSNQNTAFGFTGKDGVFQTVWHGNLQTNPGPQLFEITAGKNGYIGKYPVTATATVKVGEPAPEGGPAAEPDNRFDLP
jgi:hypothetical protein